MFSLLPRCQGLAASAPFDPQPRRPSTRYRGQRVRRMTLALLSMSEVACTDVRTALHSHVRTTVEPCRTSDIDNQTRFHGLTRQTTTS